MIPVIGDSPAAPRPLVGAGFKMHLTSSETRSYLDALCPRVAGITGCDLFVLPPFTSLWVAKDRLSGTNVAWGAQDVHAEEAGAHTGDISMPMLVDLGCTYVEVGHAERRRDHAETNHLIAAKLAQVLRHGATPVLCVGESDEADSGVALEQVLSQVQAVLAPLAAPDRERVVIAYEPNWAIGTGAATAAPEHVARVNRGIRAWLRSPDGGGVAARIIYGGSVDESTASSLLLEGEVDGLFVGRAALDPGQFAAIASAVQEACAGSR